MPIYDSNFLPEEVQLLIELDTEFCNTIADVTKEIIAVFGKKGVKQDVRTPFWHRMPFGDESWATQVGIKADRVISAIVGDDSAFLDDSLIDLLVYAVAWRAWRRMKAFREMDGSHLLSEEYNRELKQRLKEFEADQAINQMRYNPELQSKEETG